MNKSKLVHPSVTTEMCSWMHDGKVQTLIVVAEIEGTVKENY